MLKSINYLTIVAIGLNFSCRTTGENQNVLSANLSFKAEALLGEGAIWNYQTSELYWVDIEGKLLHIYNPQTATNESFLSPLKIGTVVPIEGGDAIVGLANGAYKFSRTEGIFSMLVPIDSMNQETRLNDGKCDPMGRFWVGSMHMPETKADGSLYMIDTEGNLYPKLDSVTISNGIVWSSDSRTMYYIDTPTSSIRAFDFDVSSGTISNEKIAVEIPKELGFPDGMAIDEEDKLWVGMWNGGIVARFDPSTGNLIQKIEVPAHNVTACAFGGANLDTLYITTASIDMTDEEKNRYPNAGSIFKVVPGVKGVKSSFYKQEL